MQQSPLEYIGHGQTPFFRLPTRELNAKASEGALHRAVIVGATYDGATTYAPGARMAPYHVRRMSALVGPYQRSIGCNVFDVIDVTDGGNVVFPPFDHSEVMRAVERDLGTVLSSGATPFLVGGDHSLSLGALRAAAKTFGALSVIHLDAHADTTDPARWGGQPNHGSFMREAIAEGLIKKGQLFQVGLRGSLSHPEEWEFSLRHGAQIVPMEMIEERGVREVAAAIRTAFGDRPTYLTVDIDAVDPAFAPGTGTPVPGGFTSSSLLRFIESLVGIRLVGADVMEILPAQDVSDATSLLGAHVLFNLVALRAASALQR